MNPATVWSNGKVEKDKANTERGVRTRAGRGGRKSAPTAAQKHSGGFQSSTAVKWGYKEEIPFNLNAEWGDLIMHCAKFLRNFGLRNCRILLEFSTLYQLEQRFTQRS
eukprot:RCo045040